MYWPSNIDYQEAVQNPRLCFSDPELQRGIPVLDSLGLPKPINGYYSTVYQLDCGAKKYAVKCFLKYLPDREKRYLKISRYLRSKRLSCMVDFEFQKAGILVQGRWYPVLKMQWIEGDLLNGFIQKNLSRPEIIFELAQGFLRLMQELKRTSIAHGDLQHGNILIVNQEIRLIDYDGMFIPAFKGMRSNEIGHRNYQHPYRSEKDFNTYMDHFSSWVIYLSLLAISSDPSLWPRYSIGGENLLFRKEDFTRAEYSPLLRELKNTRDSTIKSLSTSLKSFTFTANLAEIPPLDFKRLSVTNPPTPQNTMPDWLHDYVLPEEKDKKASLDAFHREASRSNAPKGFLITIRDLFVQRRLPVPVLLGLLAFLIILGVIGLLINSAAVR